MPKMTAKYKFPYPYEDDSVDPSRDIRALAEAIEAALVSPIPIGAIVTLKAGAAVPPGWALCDGSPHNSPDLQALLGSPNTPDLRGRFLRGAGGAVAVNSTGGAETVTLTDANMPPHSHTGAFPGAGAVGSHTHSPTFPAQGTSNEGGHVHSPAGPGDVFLSITPPANTLGHSGGKPGGSNVSGGTVDSGKQSGQNRTNSVGAHGHTGNANVGFSPAGGQHAHAAPTIGAASGANPTYQNMPAFNAQNFIIRTVR
jgi:microcystin-dependent protein